MTTASEQLILKYQQDQDSKNQATLDEARKVKEVLCQLAEEGLKVWLGDFADELTLCNGKEGEFYFKPSRNSDTDASVTIPFTWQGICVNLKLMAAQKLEGMFSYTRKLNACLEFCWPREDLFGSTLYGANHAIQLPFEQKPEGDWIFVQAKEPLSEVELGRVLAASLSFEQKRQAEISQSQEKRLNEQKNVCARLIEYAHDEANLQVEFDSAVQKFPGDLPRWKKIYDQRLSEFRIRQEIQEEFNEQVEFVTTWLKSWKSALDANRKKLAKIQAEWSKPISAYVLEYGVVAGDDDGEKYVHVETMCVRDDEVDETGCWVSLEYKLHRERVMHPVKVYPFTLEFGQVGKELKSKLWVPECLDYVYFATTVEPLAVVGDLQSAEFEDFPELPDDFNCTREAWDKGKDKADFIAMSYAERRALNSIFSREGDPYEDIDGE